MIKLFFTIILFVSSIASGVYLIYPAYENYELKLREIDILKEELEGFVNYMGELKTIEKRVSANERRLEKMKTAFPEDHDAPALFLYLEGMIEKHNLINTGGFGDFSVSEYSYEDTTHNRIKEVEFSLSLQGSYANIKNFLRETEKLARIIEVKSINMSSFSGGMPSGFRQEEGSPDDVVIQLSARTYSY